MAYARPFGQAQGASPWTSGVPPGLQQQQQPGHAQPIQPMFNQPMGAFDISGAWQGPPQQQTAAQQWVQPQMQQVQFVPNPTFMPPQQQQQQQHHHHNNQHQSRMQQQRSMHQRSLSAPRISANGPKRPMNQNNNNDFGGQQQRWRQQNNQPQQQQQQQRFTRQQSRVNNQKGPNNNNNNNNNNSNNNKQQQKQPLPQQQQQQQQQQPKQQQSSKQAPRKVTVKVTKVKKQDALKAKLGNKPNATGNQKVANRAAEANTAPDSGDSKPQPKAQSKTAERKQHKLQARKTAEALEQSKLPVVKANVQSADSDQKVDEPIDQAQLKCVPAVFGFVCKLCDVFLRDKVARREHIDSADHLEKFKLHEEEQKRANEAAEADLKAETTTSADSADPNEQAEVKSEPKVDQIEETGDQEDKVE